MQCRGDHLGWIQVLRLIPSPAKAGFLETRFTRMKIYQIVWSSPDQKQFVIECLMKLLKDTFSCGRIVMKFATHKIWSIRIPKLKDLTYWTIKVVWAEQRKSCNCKIGRPNCKHCPIIHNDFVKMSNWNYQEGKVVLRDGL